MTTEEPEDFLLGCNWLELTELFFPHDNYAHWLANDPGVRNHGTCFWTYGDQLQPIEPRFHLGSFDPFLCIDPEMAADFKVTRSTNGTNMSSALAVALGARMPGLIIQKRLGEYGFLRDGAQPKVRMLVERQPPARITARHGRICRDYTNGFYGTLWSGSFPFQPSYHQVSHYKGAVLHLPVKKNRLDNKEISLDFLKLCVEEFPSIFRFDRPEDLKSHDNADAFILLLSALVERVSVHEWPSEFSSQLFEWWEGLVHFVSDPERSPRCECPSPTAAPTAYTPPRLSLVLYLFLSGAYQRNRFSNWQTNRKAVSFLSRLQVSYPAVFASRIHAPSKSTSPKKTTTMPGAPTVTASSPAGTTALQDLTQRRSTALRLLFPNLLQQASSAAAVGLVMTPKR